MRALPALAVALALLVLVPAPPAVAVMSGYHQLPTEHDALGRSDEPDNQATSVLGGLVVNRVWDPTGTGGGAVPDPWPDPLGPPPAGHAATLAPGCWGDDGPKPDGACGLWTIGVPAPGAAPGTVLVPPRAVPPPVSEDGRCQGPGPVSHPPGRLSGDCRDGPVLFFDLQATPCEPTTRYGVELNRRVQATPLRSTVLAEEALAGPMCLWAWFGAWQDLNGNGVIDHLGDAQGNALPLNEFRWAGQCGERGPDVCLRMPGLAMPVWVYPGDHHGQCGVLIGCYVPADYPGREAVCAVAEANPELVGLLYCPPARDPVADPLLGTPRDQALPDGLMRDNTHQANPEHRWWTYGPNAAYFYDQSVLSTTVLVAGPTRDLAAGPGGLLFADVDVHRAFNGLVESLVVASVQPAVQGTWRLARATQDPALRLADAAVHRAELDQLAAPVAGLDDQLRDPGWSREPNTPWDRFPGARFLAHPPGGELPAGEELHRGARNDYAAHAAGWHPWADLKAQRVNLWYGQQVAGTCVGFCTPGFGYRDSLSLLPSRDADFPRAPGDHGRSLDPGVYQVAGFVGAWRDQAHQVVERVLDAEALLLGRVEVREEAYVLAPDGWVGNLVATTGTWRYRGYADVPCTLAGQRAEVPWAWCNPYLDGSLAAVSVEEPTDQSFGVDLSDPQHYGEASEWAPWRPVPGTIPSVRVEPADGTWDVPVLVLRDAYNLGGTLAPVELVGGAGAVELRALPQVIQHGRVGTRDFLVLPLGNAGEDLRITWEARVAVTDTARGIAVDATVRDVDVYRALLWVG